MVRPFALLDRPSQVRPPPPQGRSARIADSLAALAGPWDGSTSIGDGNAPWWADDNNGDDDSGLSERDRLLAIILPSVFGGLLVLLLLWILFRLNATRRRVLACEERELVHDAAITAVKEERDAEREGWYGAGWQHGRRHGRDRRRRCVEPQQCAPQILPIPVPFPAYGADYKHHHRRHHHHQYPPGGYPAIGYPGYC